MRANEPDPLSFFGGSTHAPAVRRFLLIALALVVAGGGFVAWKLNDRPSLEVMQPRVLPEAPPRANEPRIRFLGVSTIAIGDGESTLLVDGFFTRPGLASVLLGKVAPDDEMIRSGLARAGISKLDAVLVAHSHYDHAMDSAEVARQTGALLVGSESTANIGRGAGLPEDRMRVVEETTETTEMTFGDFRVTLIPSKHLPHGMAMGEIEAPLEPPARATDYLEGGSFSMLVEHPRGTMLVQSSAGWVDGALAGRKAEVVLLGVGGLGMMDEGYRAKYWSEVVEPVGARRVIPIHWDDFTRPLEDPLLPMPRMLDGLDATLAFLEERTAASGIDLAWLPIVAPVDPFGARPGAEP
ncbi:MAG: MBL fold metallo-hydrolase [Deltaproteobacteria bacterium]|nr:MBL fold metallo-hydrolase [Deltaproteobacteria bacterium]